MAMSGHTKSGSNKAMDIEVRMIGARDPMALVASSGKGIRMKTRAIVAPASAGHFLAREPSAVTVKIDKGEVSTATPMRTKPLSGRDSEDHTRAAG